MSATAAESSLADASGRVVATGTEGYELIVDAILLTVRAVDDTGEQVPMASIQLSTVVSPNAPLVEQDRDNRSSSTKMSFPAPIDSHQWVVPTTRSFLLRANDAEGVSYFGFIEARRPSGRVAIELVTRPATLGSIVVRAQCAQMPAGASLDAGLNLDGRTVFVEPQVSRGKREHGDPVTCEIAGLLPGRYDLLLALANGSSVALVERKVEVTVKAGEVHDLTLEAHVGGTLELQVESPRADEKRTFVQVEARLAGAPEWRPLFMTFSEDDGDGKVVSTATGARVVLGGPAAFSEVLTPGEYELQLTENHHRPMTMGFRIDAGATTVRRLKLTPVE